MPVKPAAQKALRQNRKSHARNLVIKLNLKKLSVRLRKAYTAKQADQAKTVTTEFIRALDKAAKAGVIHRNAAARKKSRILALQKRSA